jgi:hypothetical protein
MRKFLIALALVAVAMPASAFAGGWATAGLAPPPGDIGAGDTWKAELTLLQHGQTPLEGVEPVVTIKNGSTDKAFPAKATDKPGVYVAEVVFPSAGKWSYEVDDGFGQTHTFAPVSVAAGGGGDGIPILPISGGIVLALAAAGALFLLARRLRMRAPAPSH